MFYLVLPSSSSQGHFPGNKPSHYHTKLPQNINLDGSWEVGLAEIQFQNTFDNLMSRHLWLTMSIKKVGSYLSQYDTAYGSAPMSLNSVKVHIPKGVYHTPEDIVSVVNESIQRYKDTLHRGLTLSYNKFDRTFSFHLPQDHTELVMSPSLRSLLCFDRRVISRAGKSTSRNRFHQRFERVYVYSSIVSERVVGDSMVPLIRSIPILDYKDEIIYRLFEKPFYVPIKNRQFDVIEMLLSDERGREISFKTNTSTEITLHFRKRRD